jgi:hypothetical protein
MPVSASTLLQILVAARVHLAARSRRVRDPRSAAIGGVCRFGASALRGTPLAVRELCLDADVDRRARRCISQRARMLGTGRGIGQSSSGCLGCTDAHNGVFRWFGPTPVPFTFAAGHAALSALPHRPRGLCADAPMAGRTPTFMHRRPPSRLRRYPVVLPGHDRRLPERQLSE